ncbi:MAG: hypothetical protein GY861_03245 [bacterium]|nr:hypothetical protein [bacterium]
MPIPNAPASMDEFKQQAQNFITRARAEGKDEIGISNTLKFMYMMTQDNIEQRESSEMTPYEEAQIDIEQQKLDKGKWALVKDADDNLVWSNAETQETKPAGGVDDSNFFTDIEAEGTDDGSGVGDAPGGLDELDIDELFNTTSSTQQNTTPQYIIDAMNRIEQIDNPSRKDPITGEVVQNLDLSGVNFSGTDFSGIDLGATNFSRPGFGQPQNINRLNFGGSYTPYTYR